MLNGFNGPKSTIKSHHLFILDKYLDIFNVRLFFLCVGDVVASGASDQCKEGNLIQAVNDHLKTSGQGV